MPGYRRANKVSPAKESEFRMRALAVLSEADDAMSIDEIKKHDMILSALSAQKLSRVLNYLVEMGFARKGKSKSLNRMVYKSVSVMAAQGYDVTAPQEKEYNGLDWELEEEIKRTWNNEDEEYYD